MSHSDSLGIAVSIGKRANLVALPERRESWKHIVIRNDVGVAVMEVCFVDVFGQVVVRVSNLNQRLFETLKSD